MNDPVAILLIVVLISAAVALWMLDGTYRGRLLKTGKRAADAEEKSDKLTQTVAELRTERDKSRQRLERMEKDRDQDREQLRKLKAKVKRQGQSKKDSSGVTADDSSDVERLNAELKVLRDELEKRLNDETDRQQHIEKLNDQLIQARDRLDVFEAQAKKMSRGVRVSLVDSDVEAAKEDLPAFIKRIKTEMMILERKVRRNHEAFLSQQGKTELAVEKLKTMRDRYRAVCRELAVLISGNQNLDENEAQAVAEDAVDQVDDGWSIGEVAESWTDSNGAGEHVGDDTESQGNDGVEAADIDDGTESEVSQDEPSEEVVAVAENTEAEPAQEAGDDADEAKSEASEDAVEDADVDNDGSAEEAAAEPDESKDAQTGDENVASEG